MPLIIHAVNIHQGGGGSLLRSLIDAIDCPALLILDSRFEFLVPQKKDIDIVRFKPTILSRLKAEFYLRKIVNPNDIVLCFGNLPPLFKISGTVFVYLQNRYLCSKCRLDGLPRRVRLRIIVERLWLRFFMRDAKILVQTNTMQRQLKSYLGQDALVMPFLPEVVQSESMSFSESKFDYLYVASGEAHKNHRALIRAWIMLSEHGLRPSLRLTLDRTKDESLVNFIDEQSRAHHLKITTKSVSSEQVSHLYANSSALIYPSLFESFGLPLLEARSFGLPVIASERDYVRDVVNPDVTFDPDSELSIARAVMRHMGIGNPEVPPDTSETFLNKLIGSL